VGCYFNWGTEANTQIFDAQQKVGGGGSFTLTNISKKQKYIVLDYEKKYCKTMFLNPNSFVTRA